MTVGEKTGRYNLHPREVRQVEGWEVPAPGLGGPAGIAPSTGTLPGPVPEPPARHLHQRRMATPRAARERALLPCFWDNPNFLLS